MMEWKYRKVRRNINQRYDNAMSRRYGFVYQLEWYDNDGKKNYQKILREEHRRVGGRILRLSFEGNKIYMHTIAGVYVPAFVTFREDLKDPFPAHMTVKNYILMRMVEQRMG